MATSSETSDQNNVKSRRPAESAFKQQRLPAWQPILTAGTVLPTFFVIGIAFIPVGIGLLYFSDEVKEHTIDYTHCVKKGDTITCADYIKQMNVASAEKCICELDFNLTEDFKAEVYFYYGLTNYYQNHRRYVKSRDDNQLLGRLNQPPSSDCDPFSFAYENSVKKPVAPCGAIANSLFNDSLELHSKEQSKPVPVLRTGIAWASDKDIKFRNPPHDGTTQGLQAAFANYTKPANWAKHVWELDLEDPNNNGFQNEDLIVWMRTAALPTFRKLYRRVNHDIDGFRTGLNKGLYMLSVEYNYPVTDFDGTKSFIISTTSLLGGKNPFLGVAYVVVGTLCLLLGIVLLIIHVRCSKRMPTSTESFILDHNSNTGLSVKQIQQNPYVSPSNSKILKVPAPKNTDLTTEGAETKKFQSNLNTVNEVPEEKLKVGDSRPGEALEKRSATADKEASICIGNKSDTTLMNSGAASSSGRLRAPTTGSVHELLHHGNHSQTKQSGTANSGYWLSDLMNSLYPRQPYVSQTKQSVSLKIHDDHSHATQQSSRRQSRSELRGLDTANSGYWSADLLHSLHHRQPNVSQTNNQSRSDIMNSLHHRQTGVSRSDLTAARKRSSILAIKNKAVTSKESKDISSEPLPRKISAETFAKVETASAGIDTSDNLYNPSDETLKMDPSTSIKTLKPNEDEKTEKDKQNKH